MTVVLRIIFFFMKLYWIFVIYDTNSNIISSDYRSTILIASLTIGISNGFIK